MSSKTDGLGAGGWKDNESELMPFELEAVCIISDHKWIEISFSTTQNKAHQIQCHTSPQTTLQTSKPSLFQLHFQTQPLDLTVYSEPP